MEENIVQRNLRKKDFFLTLRAFEVTLSRKVKKMFDEEREMWEKFFGYFKKKFGEEVGILPGAFEDDDIEVDMIIGESTKLVRGIRVFQLLEDDEAFDSDEDDDNVEPDTDDDEDSEDIEDDGDDDDVDGDDDDDDDDDDEDEDFDDDDQGIWVYDLIYTKDGKQPENLRSNWISPNLRKWKMKTNSKRVPTARLAKKVKANTTIPQKKHLLKMRKSGLPWRSTRKKEILMIRLHVQSLSIKKQMKNMYSLKLMISRKCKIHKLNRYFLQLKILFSHFLKIIL